MDIYIKLFGHPRFYKWNKFLLNLAYKGLGIDQWKNMHVSGERYFLQHVLPKKENMTIFDVGAYQGCYSKEVRLFHPHSQLYSFEPHPISFRHLQKAADRLKFEAYQLGLGSELSTKLLFDFLHQDGTARASVYEDVFKLYNAPTKQHEISLTTLDNFCRERNIQHIDLLKIDAEGFEYEILEGAKRMVGSLSVDVIQFEFNQLSLMSKKTIFDFMELLSEYKFYRILYRGLIPLKKREVAMLARIEHQNIIAWSPHAQHIYDEKKCRTILR